MNIKQTQHNIYIAYPECVTLKRLGLPQGNSSAYWSNADQAVFTSERVAKFRGWEKHFTAAVTGDELNKFIPPFTLIEKPDANNYRITNPRYKVTANASTEAEAKVKFIAQLVKNKAIKLT
ncbi:MAG TPA: hypothetical protein PKE39_04355 [Ignavibacteria bacterium]|nr:hypothetical protein [Ignavibacteria bacterium]HMQ98234.1 hypothetical protein [Ignavibacteria bacterium]